MEILRKRYGDTTEKIRRYNEGGTDMIRRYLNGLSAINPAYYFFIE
ncbi:hypothetical protein [Bacteroides cellulosilyticus]|nr:hypothetical protein [Bacteroides cellulosilyticus]